MSPSLVNAILVALALFFILRWILSHQTVRLSKELKATQRCLHISEEQQSNAQHKIALLEKHRDQYDHTLEEHRKLSHAVEQSPCSIVITNLQGNIEYVNPKFTRITGYDAEEVIGQNPRVLKSGNKTSDEYSDLWHTISSGKEWEGEFHNRKKMANSTGSLPLSHP